jgi:UDP-3-O-[3-hydroxymyristoyl] glucosamine N-acyltransferase LpxD
MIDDVLISAVTGATGEGRPFAQLGLVDATESDTLSFVDDDRFRAQLVANGSITGAFVTSEMARQLAGAREDLALIVHEDPRWAYFSLYNCLAKGGYTKSPSVIADSATIHPTAFVSDYNVTIGDNTIIGPHVSILPDVRIGRDCVVQAGTVIGSEGFELKRTSRGLLSVFHDGIVDIRDRVEIGANTAIDKGFRGRPTFIDDDVRIDNVVHVAHSVRIGKGALVVAGTVLGGSSVIGDEVWLSINASIAPSTTVEEGAFVSIGSVVTRTVPKGQQVTGNFAVPHKDFLRILKKQLSAASQE